MTIRQQGGIFGRNPAFNDVSVEKLGVGTNAPLGDVQFNKPNPDFYMTSVNGGQTDIFFGSVSSPSEGNIKYSTFDNSMRIWTNGAEAVRIEGDGDLNVRIGNVIMASGKGIDFSATSGTGTSELFDDYEEGTYSVTLHDASSTGNASSTTTTGYYTKVGRVVTCSFANLTDISTAGMTSTNVLYMSLPFSAAQDASGSMAISSVSARQATGEGYVVPVVVSGNSRARFYGCRPDNAVSSIRPAELTSGTSDFFNFTMTYIAS